MQRRSWQQGTAPGQRLSDRRRRTCGCPASSVSPRQETENTQIKLAVDRKPNLPDFARRQVHFGLTSDFAAPSDLGQHIILPGYTCPYSLMIGRLGNTTLVVDNFTLPPAGVSFQPLFFLTHAHADHLTGLRPGWAVGRLFCSAVTKALIVSRFKLEPAYVVRPTVAPHFLANFFSISCHTRRPRCLWMSRTFYIWTMPKPCPSGSRSWMRITARVPS